ncbi:twin-arginine translocation pathway signal [Nocardia sp. CDC186]|uniref:Twin-arginine translocation pathway signal n=1 Tax=Nocardia implantans TaxID=3108168 RepID=A0ABU6ARL8_9NOCA|nr:MULTISPECIES: twin-arginine translocation pathway signal [unclassified Nocardia]MBF6191564.1 twin-arginine translocation pathway signal [Nocardia beijingensis]MEA3528129.1 twin-arginine translocation pathway signal [Nocardia sp. CDC192]MEB3510119.1 twin-arginine translocation pathway signal [Nocardia sp. CDC186]
MSADSAAVAESKQDVPEPPDTPPSETTEAGGRKPKARRLSRVLRTEYALPALAVLVVASVVAAACLFFVQYRPDNRTDGDAAAALDAASRGTVALLSYAPETIDHDLDAAKSFLTGGFLAYYSQFTQQVVAPAAKQKSVRTSATVVRAAVSDLRTDEAVVLVFINQTTTSAEKPDPALAASSVLVTLRKADGTWRISAFDPV